MIIPFQNILLLKEFLACNGCFGLFTKIKKGSGTSFWCTFFAWFFHRNVTYFILYQWTKFQCHTFFPSQDIKPNVLSSYLDSWDVTNFKIYFGSSSEAMADRQGEKEERKMEIQKFKYLENKKRFLDEIKNTFHSFWRAIIWW